jgi:hypothetical protein
MHLLILTATRTNEILFARVDGFDRLHIGSDCHRYVAICPLEKEVGTFQVHNKTVHWAETLSIIYVVAPVLLFFAFFVRVWIAIPACAFMCTCLVDLARRTRWVSPRSASWMALYILALAVLWLWLAGSFGGLRQNTDWIKHYSLLNYLDSHSWPAVIKVDGKEGDWAIRYSIAWYLIPALILKLTDIHAQRLVSGIWSLAGVFLFFRLLIDIVPQRRARFIVPVVFILFSGADIVGRAITHFQVGLIYHYEWWSGWIEYGSNMTSMFWVQQHAIPMWIGVALMMRQADRASALPFLALFFASVCLWSPFAAIGLSPFALLLVKQYGLKNIVFDWRAIGAVVMIAIPIGLYLTADAGDVPHGFVWKGANRCVWGPEAPCFTWASYLLVVLIEFAIPALVLLFTEQKYRGFVIVATVSLLLIPFYKLGAYNDFGMRTSIAGLAVLAILCGKAISTGPRGAIAVILFALTLGLPTALGEVARAFTDLKGPDIDSNLQNSLNEHPEVLSQYFARLPVAVLR